MRQVISEIVSYFLSPAVWVMLLIVISFLFKKERLRKISRWLALIVFLLFSNQWLLDSYARFWQPPSRNVLPDSSYSCGIVLGGFGSPDARDNSGYFNSGADRFIQAVKLYKAGSIKHIFISGGNGKKDVKDFNEGQWARQQMQAMGVPAGDVMVEDNSTNTADNAVNTKNSLLAAGINPPYVLITSAYHMPRASLIYNIAGLPHITYPCNYIAGKGNFKLGDMIPNPNVMLNWNIFMKETVGYWVYRMRG